MVHRPTLNGSQLRQFEWLEFCTLIKSATKTAKVSSDDSFSAIDSADVWQYVSPHEILSFFFSEMCNKNCNMTNLTDQSAMEYFSFMFMAGKRKYVSPFSIIYHNWAKIRFHRWRNHSGCHPIPILQIKKNANCVLRWSHFALGLYWLEIMKIYLLRTKDSKNIFSYSLWCIICH